MACAGHARLVTMTMRDVEAGQQRWSPANSSARALLCDFISSLERTGRSLGNLPAEAEQLRSVRRGEV